MLSEKWILRRLFGTKKIGSGRRMEKITNCGAP
jgi:hypothetical protein